MMTDDPSTPGRIVKYSEEWWASRSPEIASRRCRGHNGGHERCRKVAMEGQQVCGTHGGRAPQAKRKARQRIDEAQDRMARILLGIAEGAESEAVNLAAVKHVLAIGGISEKHAVAVEVELKPYEELMEGIAGIAHLTRDESRAQRGLPALAGLADPAAPIDAEVVEDPARDMGVAHPDIDGEPPKGERRGFRPDPASASGPSRGLMTMEEAVEGQRTWISSQRIRRAR
jgi:hypothetical protein